jgi:hypothetical protein
MADPKMMSFSELLQEVQQMLPQGFPPDSWYIIVVSSSLVSSLMLLLADREIEYLDSHQHDLGHLISRSWQR